LARLDTRQLTTFLDRHQIFPTTQLGFRRGQSTESAITSVLSDRDLQTVNGGDTAALLDSSATFDTVHHQLLLELCVCGIDGQAMSWFAALQYRPEAHVRCGGKRSTLNDVIYGVRQASVLWPNLFIIYMAATAAELGPSSQQYADAAFTASRFDAL
jgi:Reverse transcriptase (RNA-dependent DNA polymerase)